ncbi:hypothetical protein PVMG_06198, partial [Plasmodium vivax Mauritania I]
TDSFISPCIKCMKYLEYLDDIYEDQTSEKDEGIIYLYLWLYDIELIKTIYNGNQLNIYEKLLNAYGDIRLYETNIETIFNTKVKNTLNGELKNLYHLYYKFYKLKRDEECKNKKYQCAEECVDLYDKYREDKNCDNDSSTQFCTKLDSFWKEHAAYINESITCNGNNICLLYLRNPFLSVILTIVFITSIITIILFILYKFTPLGSRIRTRRKSKKNIWNNVDQEMYNIPDYAEMSNNISKKKPYNLAYQSVEHS